MDTPEKVVEFFQEINFDKKRLQYFIESGLLEQMCAGGKGIPFKAVAQFFSNYGAFIGMRAKYNNRFVKHMTYI